MVILASALNVLKLYAPEMTKKRVFCDSDVLKNVLKFQIFSVLKIKISCAKAWPTLSEFLALFHAESFKFIIVVGSFFVRFSCKLCPSLIELLWVMPAGSCLVRLLLFCQEFVCSLFSVFNWPFLSSEVLQVQHSPQNRFLAVVGAVMFSLDASHVAQECRC